MTPPQHPAAPPYRLVAQEIREDIRSGRLAPGDQVPSAREIEARHKIANMTARSALRLLREEGLIYSVPGRGNFVADPLPPETPAEQHGPASVSTAQFRELSHRVDELSERVDRVLGLVEHLSQERSEKTT